MQGLGTAPLQHACHAVVRRRACRRHPLRAHAVTPCACTGKQRVKVRTSAGPGCKTCKALGQKNRHTKELYTGTQWTGAHGRMLSLCELYKEYCGAGGEKDVCCTAGAGEANVGGHTQAV